MTGEQHLRAQRADPGVVPGQGAAELRDVTQVGTVCSRGGGSDEGEKSAVGLTLDKSRTRSFINEVIHDIVHGIT